MPIYSKSAQDLLIDAFIASNPALPAPLSGSLVVTGTVVKPTTVPAGKTYDATIQVYPKAISKYIGKLNLKYHRIDLAKLFRGIAVSAEQFTSAGPGGIPATVWGIIDTLNRKYGLNFTQADFLQGNFPATNTTTPGYIGTRTCIRTIYADPKSTMFKGQFDCRYVFAKQKLSEVIRTQDVGGRLFPGGNTFDSSHARVLNSDSYGIDFSPLMKLTNGSTYLNGGFKFGVSTAVSVHQALLDMITAQSGFTYTLDSANAGQPFNLYNATVTRVALPSALYPEANSQYYNNLVLITPDATVTGNEIIGKLYVHFNN